MSSNRTACTVSGDARRNTVSLLQVCCSLRLGAATVFVLLVASFGAGAATAGFRYPSAFAHVDGTHEVRARMGWTRIASIRGGSPPRGHSAALNCELGPVAGGRDRPHLYDEVDAAVSTPNGDELPTAVLERSSAGSRAPPTTVRLPIWATLAAEEASGIVASDGTAISGFTRHGIDRVIGDGAKWAGVKPQALLDALKNPNKITEGVDDLGRPFKVYTGNDARVVVNPETGQIVSVNPLSGAGANR